MTRLRMYASAAFSAAILLAGCATTARIDVHPKIVGSQVIGAYSVKESLDGFLRQHGYTLASDSTYRSIRDHAAALKSGGPFEGITTIEVWARSDGNWLSGSTLEVQLQTIPGGFAVTVFSESADAPVRGDARAIQEFLDASFPNADIKLLVWHPWPEA